MSISYDDTSMRKSGSLVVDKQLDALRNAKVTVINPTQTDVIAKHLMTCYIAGFEDGFSTGVMQHTDAQKAVVEKIKEAVKSLKGVLNE